MSIMESVWKGTQSSKDFSRLATSPSLSVCLFLSPSHSVRFLVRFGVKRSGIRLEHVFVPGKQRPQGRDGDWRESLREETLRSTIPEGGRKREHGAGEAITGWGSTLAKELSQ